MALILPDRFADFTWQNLIQTTSFKMSAVLVRKWLTSFVVKIYSASVSSSVLNKTMLSKFVRGMNSLENLFCSAKA